jgi:hypothetical protein
MLDHIKRMMGEVRDTDFLDIARNELAVARIKLMEAEAGKDYALAMIQYHSAQVTRLTALLQEGYTPPVATTQQSLEVPSMKK